MTVREETTTVYSVGDRHFATMEQAEDYALNLVETDTTTRYIASNGQSFPERWQAEKEEIWIEIRNLSVSACFDHIYERFEKHFRGRFGTDGESYNTGRLEGHADIYAKLRAILDPEDDDLNGDGLLKLVVRLIQEEDRLRGAIERHRDMRPQCLEADDILYKELDK